MGYSTRCGWPGLSMVTAAGTQRTATPTKQISMETGDEIKQLVPWDPQARCELWRRSGGHLVLSYQRRCLEASGAMETRTQHRIRSAHRTVGLALVQCKCLSPPLAQRRPLHPPPPLMFSTHAYDSQGALAAAPTRSPDTCGRRSARS